jgi:hypothetical protein
MLRKYLGVLAILAALFIGATGTVTPSMAQTNGEVPGTALGIKSDTDLVALCADWQCRIDTDEKRIIRLS